MCVCVGRSVEGVSVVKRVMRGWCVRVCVCVYVFHGLEVETHTSWIILAPVTCFPRLLWPVVSSALYSLAVIVGLHYLQKWVCLPLKKKFISCSFLPATKKLSCPLQRQTARLAPPPPPLQLHKGGRWKDGNYLWLPTSSTTNRIMLTAGIGGLRYTVYRGLWRWGKSGSMTIMETGFGFYKNVFNKYVFEADWFRWSNSTGGEIICKSSINFRKNKWKSKTNAATDAPLTFDCLFVQVYTK